MYKSYLRTRETWAVPVALAVLVSCLWLPAARGDIVVSNGGGSPNSSQASSYSWITGAPKLTFTGALVASEGLAIGPDGNLYVADGGTGAVLRFMPSSGALIGIFVAPNSNSAPAGITFGPDNNLYMADRFGAIRQFNGSTGAPMGTFSCSTPVGVLCTPYGLTFGPDGNLYVSDTTTDSVVQLNGSTLAFMRVFVPTIGGGAGVSQIPFGLHFGPNGNLYVLWVEVEAGYGIGFVVGHFILEFSGSSGTQIAGFKTSDTGTLDFTFGPNEEIYTAGDYQFLKFSSLTGTAFFQSGFGSSAGLADAQNGFIIGPVSIPPYMIFDPVSATPKQTLRLTVRVPPGVPVEATLGFLTKEGAPVGPSKVVSLSPGQAASLDLEVSTLISSGRIDLQPTVTAGPGAPPRGSLQGSVEVFTTSNGIGSVFYPGIPVPPTSNVTGPPSFVPQGVVYGQSIQINALAPPDSPCVALLNFADVDGNRVGPRLNVNLSPGTMTSLTFNPNSITQNAGRQEFVPKMAPSNAGNPAGGPGIASACLGSAEVIDQLSSAVATYQISSPAVGTSPAVVP